MLEKQKQTFIETFKIGGFLLCNNMFKMEVLSYLDTLEVDEQDFAD